MAASLPVQAVQVQVPTAVLAIMEVLVSMERRPLTILTEVFTVVIRRRIMDTRRMAIWAGVVA